jgi:hypothetical protein
MNSKYQIIPFLILCLLEISYAGNGKISGIVKDNNGKSIVGATILVEGTIFGAYTDSDGKYFILNIPPGKYNIISSSIGYTRKIFKDVIISSDLTTELNIELKETAVQIGEIVIQAERKLVDKTLTSTRSIVSSDELSNTLPITSTYEILQTAPSVYRGFIRGGKQDQTKTIIDGVDVSDDFFGQATESYGLTPLYTYLGIPMQREGRQSMIGSINSNAVSELSVNTGALNAEYSSASAGIINYSLKEGKGPISGRLYLRSSSKKLDYFGSRIYGDDSLYMNEKKLLESKTDPASLAKAGRYTYSPGKYGEGQNAFEADMTLNGSITQDLGFFFSSNLKNNLECRLPNQSYRELNTQLKLSYNLTPEIKIIALSIINDRGKLLGWKNSNYDEYLRFFMEGIPKYNGLSWIASLKMTHFLSRNTFYEVQISNKKDISNRGFVDGNNDGNIELNEKGDFITFQDTTIVNKYMSRNNKTKFFSTSPRNESDFQTSFKGIANNVYGLARPGIYYEDFSSNTFTVKADLTSQINFNHQLKTGLIFKLTEYDMNRIESYVGGYDANRDYMLEIWNKQPIESGLYIQDRMEYVGLVINTGFRVDYWDPKVEEFSNFFKPYTQDSVWTDYGKFIDRSPIRGEQVKPYIFFSPRIAVSHPVSDNAAIYFSFSKTSQPPPASIMYSNYNDFSNPSIPRISSATRKPYYTTNYEFGGQWEIIPSLSINVNAYFKDIENYNNYFYNISPRSSIGSNYEAHFSSGYANARGVELQLESLPVNLFDVIKLSGRVSYTYSYLKEPLFNGVDVRQDMQKTFSTSGSDSARFNGTLPFDDFKYYTKIERHLIGGANLLVNGYDREHRISYTFFARFPYDISLTSIGTFQSGFFWAKRLIDSRVTGRQYTTSDWNSNIDLRIEKSFTLFEKYRVAFYADIKNILNKKNIVAYDNSIETGADRWEKEGNPEGTANRPISLAGSLFYDIPREFYFGVNIDF